MWGVFSTDDPYVVHVVPIDANDQLASGHKLDLTCSDISRVELSDHGIQVVIHEEIN